MHQDVIASFDAAWRHTLTTALAHRSGRFVVLSLDRRNRRTYLGGTADASYTLGSTVTVFTHPAGRVVVGTPPLRRTGDQILASSFRRRTRLISLRSGRRLGSFGWSNRANTSCICGTVGAGIFFPRPILLQDQKPQCQQRKRHMVKCQPTQLHIS